MSDYGRRGGAGIDLFAMFWDYPEGVMPAAMLGQILWPAAAPCPLMAALLVYCDSQGVFSLRRIERATWHSIAVPYLTGDTRPEHDTICGFRRKNKRQLGGHQAL